MGDQDEETTRVIEFAAGPTWPADTPWIRKALAGRRLSRAPLHRATRPFVEYVLGRVPIADVAAKDRAVQEFMDRLAASPTIRAWLPQGVSPEALGALLEEIVVAYGRQLRTARRRLPDEDRDPLSPLSTRQLRDGRDALQRAASFLRDPADPVLQREDLAGAVEKTAQQYDLVLTARGIENMMFKDPFRKPYTPLRRIGEAVDRIVDGSKTARDRITAALAQELLGIDADPQSVNDLMKRSRMDRAGTY